MLVDLFSSDVGTDFHTVLFDANPLPTFVLDAESRVIDFNAAATEFLGTPPSEVFGHRTGDLFQCKSAMESIDCCDDQPGCAKCGLRIGIHAALHGNGITRYLHSMELIRNDEPVRVDFLLTTAPVHDGTTTLVLMILQDVTELMRLRQNQLPIVS